MHRHFRNNFFASTHKNILGYIPVLLVGTCLFIIGIYVDHLNVDANKNKAYNTLLNKVGEVRARIEGTINSNAQIVKGLVAAMSIEPNMTQERFIALSTPLLTGSSQIRNIAAAPDFVIRYMNPVIGNEAAIGLDYRTISEQYDAVKIARDAGTLVLDGPVNLVQGGQGFIARIPVFIQNETEKTPKFWGIISSVIDIDKFFEASGLNNKDLDFNIAIRQSATSIKPTKLIFGDEKIFDSNPLLTNISLPYGTWTLAATPKHGWTQNNADILIFRATLFIIALLFLIPLFILDRRTQKLKESEAFLKLLFNLSPMGIALTDYDTGAFIEVNDILLKKTGYNLDEFVQLSFWDITPKKYEEDEIKQLQCIENTGEYGPYEKEYIRKDGSQFPVVLNGIKITDSSGKKLVCSFIEDISERKQAEKSLQRSQKMDAIGHLTGGIAHDFNNIMGIILGNLELLENDIDKNPEKAHLRIGSIYKAGQRAVDLTKQLLIFSRKKPSKQDITNVNSLIEKMQNLIARSVTPEIEVSLQLSENLRLTNINQGEFEDAILNLCINARDSMNSYGQLSISTRNATIDEIYSSKHTDASPGEYIEIAISDSGEGISAEQLEHIFEPFYTTKEEGKGTGLGLAMVYGFAQRSNGFIDVISKKDVGTTFKIYLPKLDRAEESKIEQLNIVKQPLQHGSEKILVVDDELMLLELARTLLSEMGYQVIVATNGKQALELLQQEPDINMLFSDVVMPGELNGFQLAEKVTHDFPNIKILLTSGHTGKAESHGNSQNHNAAKNLISKPYTKNELAERVRMILDE